MTSSIAQEGRKPPSSFVGREQELTELCAALDEISARGRVFLISGEPGIGKTRLSDELSAEARGRGFRVVWGRCWEDAGTPAYWPFIQIVRACFGSIEASQRLSISEFEITPQVIEEVAQIVPELRPAHGYDTRGSQVAPETARFRLFDAVTNLLKQFARATPMLLVIDDLHDADPASLAMLSFVARELHDARIVIVGTYRDAEMHRSAERLKLVEETLREGNLIPLAGLAESEVRRMVEARIGPAASEGLATKVHWLTSGNPLFVDGVVRILAAEREPTQAKDLAGIRLPDNVRGAIAHWIAMLSGEARSVLSIASAIGHEFELALLGRTSSLTTDALAETIEQARKIGIVIAAHDCYRFAHPLIREALRSDQKDAVRIATHRAIGEALEKRHSANLEPQLAQLAYHFREGSVVEKAIDYSIRAGEAANMVFAYQEAAYQFQAALDLMEKAGIDIERRAGLWERLASVAFAFDERRTIASLEHALRLYESLDRTDRLTPIHTELGVRFSTGTALMDVTKGQEHIRKAEAALAKVPSERARAFLDFAITAAAGRTFSIREGLAASSRGLEIATRLPDRRLFARIGGQRALHLMFAGRWAEGFAMLDDAWQIADALDDQLVLYGINLVRMSMTGIPMDPRAAVALMERELAKSRTSHASYHQVMYRVMLQGNLASMGELAEARRYRSIGDIDSTVALYEGRWEDVEQQCVGVTDWLVGGGARAELFGHFYLLQLVRRLLHKYPLAEKQLLDTLALCRRETLLQIEMQTRPILILLYEDLNRHAESRPHVARCREIMGIGENWRGLAGPATRADAVVTAAEGDLETAGRRFTRALEIFRQYSLPFEEAETLYYWGRALTAVGDSGANEKFDAAIEIYRRHGAGQRWIERVEEARRSAAAPRELGAVVAASPGSPGLGSEKPDTFLREGEFWTITYDGRTIRLKDTKGLRYLGYLLSHQGERFRAHDLVAIVERSPEQPQVSRLSLRRLETSGDLGDVGPILDDKAKASYRRRRQELHQELDEAEAMNDAGRAERARAEMEMLEQQLSAAIGLGGRDRKGSAHAERARLVVTRNIRAALGKIGEEHPPLGRHFNASIKTGYLCTYLPAPESLIVWNL